MDEEADSSQMKIAIGFRLRSGPWGGGNRFAHSLSKYLLSIGHEVVYALGDPDIDIILLTDPRSLSPGVAFGAGQVYRHMAFKNSNVLVVHRVNECDERKGTWGMNAMLRIANKCADHTVFVGNWLTTIPAWRRHRRKSHSVILNGADEAVFNSNGKSNWDGKSPLRIVTHHWSNHWNKGFEVYKRLDDILDDPSWRKLIAFTYIGNLPAGFKFRNTQVLDPMDGFLLAAEIKRNHAYITGSINEPGGNHQVEAGSCGLPILYRESGCMPEYCEGFGFGFEGATFEGALNKLFVQYQEVSSRMASWNNKSSVMCEAYHALFKNLLENKEDLIFKRRHWARPWFALLNQIPLR